MNVVPTQLKASERSIAIDGCSLYCKQFGSGAPLFCIHGGLGLDSSYLETPGIVELATRERQIVLVDQRGNGRSQNVGPLTNQRWAQDLHELPRNFGSPTGDVLGHSYGNVIALRTALEYPKTVRSLILVSGYTWTKIDPSGYPRPIDEANLRESYSAWWPTAFAGANKHPDVFARIAISFPGAAASYDEGLRGFDFRSELSRINQPTLVIAGAQDGPFVECARELASGISGSELQIVDDAGHFPFIENPRRFREIVSDFLGRLPNN